MRAGRHDDARPAGPRRNWLHGLTWQGIAIVVCFALVNALRRNVLNIADDGDFDLAQFADAVATGLIVGFAMLVAVVATLNRYPERGGRQYLRIGAAIVVAGGVGVLVKDVWELAGPFADDPGMSNVHFFLADWLRYAVPGSLIAGAYLYLRAEAEHAAITHRCHLESEQMAREVAEARLRVLEAQVEPHFLFNTLATVKRLFQTDAAAGRRVLDNLMRYLSGALPRMRSAESTLGHELSLATAYLDIQRIRMGRRLTFGVDVPASLRRAALPPFMLLTLIENAIKHGLNPLPDGGAIHIVASTIDGRLVVTVRDTGRGFVQSSGSGPGPPTSGCGLRCCTERARGSSCLGTSRAASSLRSSFRSSSCPSHRCNDPIGHRGHDDRAPAQRGRTGAPSFEHQRNPVGCGHSSRARGSAVSRTHARCCLDSRSRLARAADRRGDGHRCRRSRGSSHERMGDARRKLRPRRAGCHALRVTGSKRVIRANHGALPGSCSHDGRRRCRFESSAATRVFHRGAGSASRQVP